MQLELPNKKYFSSFIEAAEEFADEGATVHHPTPIDIKNEQDFLLYIKRLENQRQGINLKSGYVADTNYWMIHDEKYCGQISIRHQLTPALEVFGGHIGYAVRPSERKKGYATERTMKWDEIRLIPMLLFKSKR